MHTPLTSDDPEQMEQDAERVKALLLEVQTASYGYAQTYTTVVIFGAYAGLFAIWAFTKEYLGQTSTYWIALMIGISMLAFVLFEIFRMVVHSLDFLAIRKLLVKELPPVTLLAERRRLATTSNLLVQRIVIPLWVVALLVSVAAGVCAAFLLLYNFAGFLLLGL